MFRCCDSKTFSLSNLYKLFCSSKSLVNNQDTHIYRFSLCDLAHKNKYDNQCERVSLYAKQFHELKQGHKQFCMKIEDILTFKRLSFLNKKVFQLSSSCISLSPKKQLNF